MSLAFDADSNALYLRFSQKGIVDSEEIRPGLVLDFDESGRVVAIEIRDADKVLAADALAAKDLPGVTLLARSGEKCPISGVWHVLNGSESVSCAKGQIMPRVGERDVTWLLASAA